MKKLLVFVITTTVTLTTAQLTKAQTFDVVAGDRVGELALGMNQNQCIEILGEPYRYLTYEEERLACANFGYVTDSLPQFMEGFDQCLEWDEPKKYPVFKLFFRDSTLIFMTLTSYSMDEALWKPARIKKSGFFSSKKKVLKQFGKPDYVRNDPGYDGFYTYWSKGIILGFDEGELRVVNLFFSMKL